MGSINRKGVIALPIGQYLKSYPTLKEQIPVKYQQTDIPLPRKSPFLKCSGSLSLLKKTMTDVASPVMVLHGLATE